MLTKNNRQSDTPRLSRPIFLIGYMGSGKTTLGRALARELGIDFIDLDDYIEDANHLTISEIFARDGEDGFRRIERDALLSLAATDAPTRIIACGGGTPCFFDNIDVMNRAGTTVFLDASRPALLRRLSLLRANRPLIANLPDDALADFIDRALQTRLPYYTRANHSFCSDFLESTDEIAASVNQFIDSILT